MKISQQSIDKRTVCPSVRMDTKSLAQEEWLIPLKWLDAIPQYTTSINSPLEIIQIISHTIVVARFRLHTPTLAWIRIFTLLKVVMLSLWRFKV